MSSPADRSVLVTTFTTALAGSLEDGLRLLVDDEDVLRRLDVRNLDQVAHQVVAAEHGRPAVLPSSEENARWKRLIARFGLDCTEAFLGQEWRQVDDMNEELETLAGCRSDVHGSSPTLHGFRTRSVEMEHLVSTARGWFDGGVAPGQIGIAARSGVLVEAAVAALSAAGIAAVSLAKRPAKDGEVSVATMHRMKGLEFRCVAVVGVGAHYVPPSSAVTPATEDQASHDLDVQRERCLLFVACTRAREELLVSWHGNPSPLLPS